MVEDQLSKKIIEKKFVSFFYFVVFVYVCEPVCLCISGQVKLLYGMCFLCACKRYRKGKLVRGS